MSGKKCFYSAFIVAACCSLIPGAFAEEIVSIDMREDKAEEGHYVLFCSRYLQEHSMKGDAFVALATGDSPASLTVERAFGLRIENGEMVFGALTAKQVDAVRRASGTPAARALIVKADAAQFEAVGQILERWAAKPEYEYSIDVENTDMTLAVTKPLGLYPPYRKAWEPTNPVTYYVDLGKLNRNM